MLVRDQHRASPVQGVRAGPDARVDHQDSAVLLQPDTGMLQLGEPHDILPQRSDIRADAIAQNCYVYVRALRVSAHALTRDARSADPDDRARISATRPCCTTRPCVR